MTLPDPDGDATVIPVLDGDVLTVRFGATSPFGEAELTFVGDGVLTFDPAAPNRLLSVSTRDPEAALTTLSAVFGAAGASDLVRWRVEGEAAGPVRAQPTERLAPLARLALVSWLEQWSPLEIPREAVLADVGEAAWRAGNGLLALRSFSQAAGFLSALAERGLAIERPEAIRVALLDVLEVATESLGPAQPDRAALEAAARQYRAANSLSAQQLAQRFEDMLDADLVATAADQPTDLGASELETTFSVDWAMVPNRVFRSTEGQVHLTRSPEGISVTVDPARWLDVTETFGLAVRLLDPVTGASLATTPLRWEPSSRRFAGQVTFDASTGSADREALLRAIPEVFAEHPDGSRPRPRIGDSRTAAQAWRQAVWGLVHHRRSRAAALVFGQAMEREDTQADRAARRAELALQPLGAPYATTVQALKAWRDGLKAGAARAGTWPSGLLVPGSVGVDRPLLSEMIEIAAPDLWPA